MERLQLVRGGKYAPPEIPKYTSVCFRNLNKELLNLGFTPLQAHRIQWLKDNYRLEPKIGVLSINDLLSSL